jgi:hypothetical protein
MRRCLWSLGALRRTPVRDRQAGLHAGGGRSTGEFAAFCGRLRVGWHFCDRGDPQGQGRGRVAARLPGAQLRAWPPVRYQLDYQIQLDDRSTSGPTGGASHAALSAATGSPIAGTSTYRLPFRQAIVA